MMLDNILNLVKEHVLPVITNNAEVPQDKKEQAVDTTASTIISGLKEHLIPDNMADLKHLFGGETNSSFGNNVMVQGIQSSVASALTQKVGLSSTIADTIASAVVPAVINLFSKKGDNGSGLDVESLIKALINGKSEENQDGDLLGKVKGLFGMN